MVIPEKVGLVFESNREKLWCSERYNANFEKYFGRWIEYTWLGWRRLCGYLGLDRTGEIESKTESPNGSEQRPLVTLLASRCLLTRSLSPSLKFQFQLVWVKDHWSLGFSNRTNLNNINTLSITSFKYIVILWFKKFI